MASWMMRRRSRRKLLVLDRKTLSRIKSERLELPAPFGRQIAETLDADAAGQATFYSRFD
jgi:hypothetical protein